MAASPVKCPPRLKSPLGHKLKASALEIIFSLSSAHFLPDWLQSPATDREQVKTMKGVSEFITTCWYGSCYIRRRPQACCARLCSGTEGSLIAYNIPLIIGIVRIRTFESQNSQFWSGCFVSVSFFCLWQWDIEERSCS